jgi:hypothetical protein
MNCQCIVVEWADSVSHLRVMCSDSHCWTLDDGKIVAVLPPDPDSEDSDVDIAGAVADSVEVTMKDEEETNE